MVRTRSLENPPVTPEREAPPSDGAGKPAGEAEGGSLPFDLRTVMVGLWRRRLLVVLVIVLGPALGTVTGGLFGKRTYESETVMLYQPSSWARGGTGDAPSLRTLINMVKIQSNMEETRKKLNLSCTIASLSSAVEVQVAKETTLLTIRATAGSAQGAADLANTMRDVYLHSQVTVRQSDAHRELQDLETRLGHVRKQLTAADSALQKYVADNSIVDLDKELNRYLEEYTSVDILYQQAVIEKRTNELQAANVDKVINDLRARVAKEQNSSRSMESLGDLNIRSQRLRESIQDDKSRRTNVIDLTRAQVDLDRAERLLKRGAISQAEVHQIRANYEKQKAVTVDTPQIQAWKRELARIDATIIPKSNTDTASTPVLKEMLMRQFNIQLEGVSLKEKVAHLQTARVEIKEKLEGRAGLQRGYQALVREISAREAERKTLETSCNQARRALESVTADFTVIAAAPVPAQPLKSNRKMVTGAVTVVVLMLGLGVLVGLELLDPTVKSPAEASLRLKVPVLAALPRISAAVLAEPMPIDEPVFDSLRLMARRLESSEQGEVVLVTAARPHEGTTFVVQHLAACLARQDKRVLVVDCRVRRSESADDGAGLCDLLGGSVTSLQSVVQPGPVPQMSLLGAGRQPSNTDRLGSPRMGAILDEACASYDVVILDSPSLQRHVESDLLVRWAHRLVLVVKARGSRVAILQRLLARLRSGSARPASVVLNQVDASYLDRT